LEKRNTLTDTESAAKSKPKPVKPIDEVKEKAKEDDQLRKSQEKKRKANNSVIRDKINKILKKREDLELESYAKSRALSNPHFYRDEEIAKEYGRRMKEIERLLQEMDAQIKALENQII
jgi:tRNA(Ile)-lysidine synthase TilS/MesJ